MEIDHLKILQACLDTVKDNPAWIVNSFGSVIANNSSAEDFIFNDIDFDRNLNKINNKIYKTSIKEMNHGTGCFLYELIDEEAIKEKLGASIDKLALYLENTTYNSINY